ncbi:hypothetical protein DCAR_0832486 [Daucus carota subsp. sativus]|uniref:PGG domain-containing protein n=1 Tax=Daucus carota subsp. sativus TaxID=79200 RepID=A0AAF0XTD1_DAUCS|nr:hypothetical protein DCAR_0832486 [Daucus carota subsp. sativus]
MWENITIFKKSEKEKDQSILVGATVIAAMAYQAAISPPGSVAAQDSEVNLAPTQQDANNYMLQPGSSLLAYFYSDLSNVFWIFNTISLMAALSVIFLYVSGFSLKRRIEIWLIRVAMWVTLSSMTVAYVCAVIATTPTVEFKKISDTFTALIIGVVAWVGLLCLSFLVLLFRFVRYLMKKKKTAGPDAENMVR